MVVKFVLIRRFRKYDHEYNHCSSGNFRYLRLSCKIHRDKIVHFVGKYRSLSIAATTFSVFFYRQENNFSFLRKNEKSAGTIGEYCPSFCASFARTIDGILARIVRKMKKTVNQKVVKSSTREFTCSPLIRCYLRCLAS